MLNKKLKLRKRFLRKRQLILDRINKEKKQRFDEINRNEDLVLFDKKFCWKKGECDEPYYDKNSFKVT